MSTLRLKTMDDWDAWIDHVQGMAQPGDCLNLQPYIDPSLATQPIEPIAPTKPSIASACTDTPAVTTYALLKATDRIAYDFLYKEYNELLKINTKQRVILYNIRLYINNTVASENLVYLRNKNTNQERLVALKKRLAPTNNA